MLIPVTGRVFYKQNVPFCPDRTGKVSEASLAKKRPQAFELNDLGKNLATARRSRGLTQAALALRSGLKAPQITYFENGSRSPDLNHLLRIAKALDLPVQSFLGGAPRPGGTLSHLALE